MKIYTLIGGVNGAGKSSLTGSLRAERSDLGQIVDPDALTARCGGDEYEGGKLAVDRIETALAEGVNFTQETTLSGGYPKRLCRRAKEAGYYIRLYYVGLDTAEESLRRIKNRVERGGHDIPAKDVQDRFAHRFTDVAKVRHTVTRQSFLTITTALCWWPNTATGSFCRLAITARNGSAS